MVVDDKESVICLVSVVDAREPGQKIQLALDLGVSMYADLPSNGLALSPFQSQLYKAFNTTFKLMVFLLEKKKIKD